MLCYALFILFTLKLISASNEPLPWKKDTVTEDCRDCMVYRYYECEDNAVCNQGVFKDSLYSTAFRNHCFGRYALDQSTIDDFFTKFYSGKKGWRDPLNELVTTLHETTYWGNPSYSNKTKCALTLEDIYSLRNQTDRKPPERKKNKKRKRKKRKRQRSVEPQRPHISKQLFYCPINKSVIWMEQIRYCGPKDSVVHYSECICHQANTKGRLMQTGICFDDYGYLNNNCTTYDLIPCYCPISINGDVTVASHTNSPKVSTAIASNFTTTVKQIGFNATTTLNNQPLKSILTTVVIVLSACLMVVIITVIVFCGLELLRKSVGDQRQSRAGSPHQGSTIGDRQGGSNQQDPDYFCMANKQGQSVYQTIGAYTFKPNPPSEVDPLPPALPLRLFSVGGSSLRTPPRSRCTTEPSVYLSPIVSEPKPSTEHPVVPVDQAYDSISVQEEEYDLPPPADDPEFSDVEFSDDPCYDDRNDDMRVNPLYASEDDMQ
nr:uncharacterized protein LOC100181583 isoform X1 [Ciona intestinalis]|eukprot:XP_018668407.1 uncharacterized protein LOC100181583 isoform X1 [Ciona intestinalis]